MSKDHFYFSRNDRIVALVLLSVIVVTNILRIPHKNEVPVPEVPVDTVTVTQAPKSKTTARSNRSSDTSRPATGNRSQSSYRRDSITRKYVRDTTRSIINAPDSIVKNRYTSKRRPMSPLDLNALDSAGLVSLPGIGPVYASRILRYREQLGGFASTKQLLEINGLPDSLMEWFIITDTIQLKMIEVNKGTVNELRSHPYMNFYQARAIVELRRERGKIKGPEQLSLLEEFTAQDLERLKPYLDFR
ncbi:MAG: helix-hairpin-helix domain-containing protein [Bacteroidaceae bacterium]|nr:helix-hairpin-helix domain-containing protein [Bacteroidaceae bacterium]